MSSHTSTDALRLARQPAGGSPSTVVGRLVGRRAVRSGAGWGAAFGVYVGTSALGYASAYPTAASRHQLAQSLGSNAGLAALLGQARQIDTVAGFTAWRSLGILSMVGAVWGILAGTRLLRGEEDAGRWELLLAGQTTRRRAAAQGLVGLAAGWAALWATTAVITVAAGRRVDPSFPLGEALFFSIALVSSAAMFLAIGALAGQLAATRRQAATIAGGVFGASLVMRLVADSGSRLQWLRWASPLGWVEGLHPMTGSQPLLLVPIVVLVAGVSILTLRLAGDRDLGASILPAHDSAAARTRLLSGPAGLAVRLIRPTAVGWIAAIGAGGLLLGLVAQSAADATAGSTAAQEILGHLGAPRFDAKAYLGVAFLFVITAVCLVAAGQVAATREEEADGRLDNLLVRPVSRSTWLAGRLAAATGLVVACGLFAGILAWVGAISQGTDVGFGGLVLAGLNAAPPALFVLGLGTLAHGVLPRLAAVAAYGLIAWSFLVELIGSVLNASQWLLDTSVLHHVAPAPATDPDWISAAGLVGLGLAAAIIGGLVFSRRDLVTA
jgi:ABC-2 type transport system permease protein